MAQKHKTTKHHRGLRHHRPALKNVSSSCTKHLDKVPVQMAMSDATSGDTEHGDDMPSLSFKSSMEDDDSIVSSDSDDDSLFSSSSETKHDNQKVSSARAELNDLQDLFFLHDSVNQLHCNRWEFKRLDWEAHVAQVEHDGLFENEYLMSLPAHRKLV